MNYSEIYVTECFEAFENSIIGTQHERDCEECQRIIRGEPRFEQTHCSQCGEAFGPGDHGFSHCQDHAHLEPVED